MEHHLPDDAVMQRINMMNERVTGVKEAGLYFYNLPITELRGGAKVIVNGREMGSDRTLSQPNLGA